MPQIERAGRFVADCTAFGLTDNKQKMCAVIEFLFTGEYDPVEDKWNNIQDEQLTHKEYFYLETNTGELNDISLRQIKETFGGSFQNMWEWQSIAPGMPCQLVMKQNNYKDKINYQVKVLANQNWDGGSVRPVTQEQQQSWLSRFGAQLRELDGGGAAAPEAKSNKPAPAKKAAATTKAPAAPPAPPKRTPPHEDPKRPAGEAGTPPKTMNDAYGVFHEALSERNFTDEQITSSWFAALEQQFPGQKPEAIGTNQWARFIRDVDGVIEALPPF